MKRFFLFLTIILCFALAFSSCGNEEKTEETKKEEQQNQNNQNNQNNPLGVKVTKDEWVNAFKFTGVDNIAFTYSITEGESTTIGNIKYDGNFIFTEETRDNRVKEESWTIVLGEEQSIQDEHFFWDNGDYRFGQGVFEFMSNYLDYNYAGVTFDEKTGTYHLTDNATDYDDNLIFVRNISITFGNDKRFSHISLVEDYSEGYGTTVEFSYDFSYPTDSIVMPIDRAKTAFEKSYNFENLKFGITDNQTYETIWYETMDPNLEALLSSLDVNNTVLFEFEQKGSGEGDIEGTIGIAVNPDFSSKNTTIYGVDFSCALVEISFYYNYCVYEIKLSGPEGNYLRITVSYNNGDNQ